MHQGYGDKVVLASDSQGYLGEREDAETGLVYLNARTYDARPGRFLLPDSLDPVLRGGAPTATRTRSTIRSS